MMKFKFVLNKDGQDSQVLSTYLSRTHTRTVILEAFWLRVGRGYKHTDKLGKSRE